MKKMLIATIALGLMSTLIMADGAAAYKRCAGCHGANGEKPGLGKSKILSKMTKKELADAMLGYQDGSYGGSMKGLMSAQVKSLSKGDIEAIASHIGK